MNQKQTKKEEEISEEADVEDNNEEVEQEETKTDVVKVKKPISETRQKGMELGRNKALITRTHKKLLREKNPTWSKEELDAYFETNVRKTLNYTGQENASKEDMEKALPKLRRKVNTPKEQVVVKKVDEVVKKVVKTKPVEKETPKVEKETPKPVEKEVPKTKKKIIVEKNNTY